MKHQYQIGTWIAFTDVCNHRLSIDEVCYLIEMDSHPHAVPGYVTRGGIRVQERDVLEARQQGGE